MIISFLIGFFIFIKVVRLVISLGLVINFIHIAEAPEDFNMVNERMNK